MTDISDFTVDGLRKAQIEEVKAKDQKEQEEVKAKEAQKSSHRSFSTYLKTQLEREKISLKDDQKHKAEAEEVVKKQLHAKVNRYLTTFPFLSDKVPKIGAKTSVPELEEILKIIRDEMDSQRSLIQVHKYMDFGFMVLGNYWGDGSKLPPFVPPPLRFNLSGLAQYSRQGLFRNELEPLLLEIDIEYPWIGRQSLPLRVIETLTEVMYKTHMINTNPQARILLGLEKAPPKDVKLGDLPKEPEGSGSSGSS